MVSNSIIDSQRTVSIPKLQEDPGYRTIPFSTNRRMVAASAALGREQNNIQAIIEVDISEPRRLIREHRERSGKKLSLTAYVTACLARAITEYPRLNAFRKGSNIIVLEDLTISVLVEREIDGEMIPEPFGIQCAQSKTYRHFHDEIRNAQAHGADGLGGLSGMTWLRFIPSFLFTTFIRLASRNIQMRKKTGTVSVTAVGMFGGQNQAAWGIPLVSGATVSVAVGGIVQRPCIQDGQLATREHLCLTVIFDHDIVDGAPAARFVKRFSDLLTSGELLWDETGIPKRGEKSDRRER